MHAVHVWYLERHESGGGGDSVASEERWAGTTEIP